MNLSEFLMFLVLCFVLSINQYLSINTIVLKLTSSYYSGKSSWGGARVPREGRGGCPLPHRWLRPWYTGINLYVLNSFILQVLIFTVRICTQYKIYYSTTLLNFRVRVLYTVVQYLYIYEYNRHLNTIHNDLVFSVFCY